MRALAVKDVAFPLLQALMEGPNIPLDKPIILIGRHQECDIQIPSRKISRRHCCLAQVGDHLVVRDLGSTNGVRINGVRVTEGNVQPGDELTIGNIRYQLHWGHEPRQSDPRQAPGGPMQFGFVAKAPAPHRKSHSLESCEMPVALPEVDQSQPILLAKPNAPAPPNNPE
jgi:predicted component of type VI protein secretion system